MGPKQALKYSTTKDIQYTTPVVIEDIVQRSKVYQEAHTRIRQNPTPPRSHTLCATNASLDAQHSSPEDMIK